MTSMAPARRGDLLAIAFAVLSIGGLALWFGGANMPDTDSAAVLADRMNSEPVARAGATVLIAAMIVLIGYARWLSTSFRGNPSVNRGAAILALGGLTHLVENILVLWLLAGDTASGDGLWDAISIMSPSAFALLGLGALVVALGLTPTWLKAWGVVTGLLGVAAGLSAFAPSLSFLPGPFNISFLVWLIVVGSRNSRK